MREPGEKGPIIAVFGNGFTTDLTLTDSMTKRVDHALKEYKRLTDKGLSPLFAGIGKYTFNFRRLGVVPPITEAQLITEYAMHHPTMPVPQHLVRKADLSEDTVFNFKELIMLMYQNNRDSAVVFCSEHAKQRVVAMAEVFSKGKYSIKVVAKESQFSNDPDELRRQKEISDNLFNEQKDLIHWVAGLPEPTNPETVYAHPHYRRKTLDAASLSAFGDTGFLPSTFAKER